MLYLNYLKMILSSICLITISDLHCMRPLSEKLAQSTRSISVYKTRPLADKLAQCQRTLTIYHEELSVETLHSVLPHFLTRPAVVTLGSRFGSIAKNEKDYLNTVLISVLVSRIELQTSPLALDSQLVSREGVTMLFSSLLHLVTTRSSAYSMDGRQADNTTLYSLISDTKEALAVGPFKDVVYESPAQYARLLTAFIITMGPLQTDKSNKLLMATNMETAAVTNFIRYMNFGPDGNGLYHPNDVGFFKRRKKQRLYHRVHENIRLILSCLLTAAYSGYDIESLSPPIHKSGEGTPLCLLPLIERTQIERERTSVSAVQMSQRDTLVTDSFNISTTTTLSQTVSTTLTQDIDIVAYRTEPLDFIGIKALAILLNF